MERMGQWGYPSFIDITWGAGGRLSTLTCEMVAVAQGMYGLDTCMHLTCTDMPREKIETALAEAYNAGCQNILALRGDPPRDQDAWTATEGGFQYASDLVTFIREQYGDYFCIGVAGYPEGHSPEESLAESIAHLKFKVDCGASFIVTQMFYNVDAFLDWVGACRAAGITVPIIPGIMPIQNWDAFIRRARWSGASIPEHFMSALQPIKDNDAAVREVGSELLVDMCRKLIDSGINNLHFYTMNLEKSVKMVIEGLGLLENAPTPALPWRRSLALKRKEENVRPVFWKNRNKSYIERTQDWDEFPNGRWGDARSPAFGEVERYSNRIKQSSPEAQSLWGAPTNLGELARVFIGYIQGRIPALPWSEQAISAEAQSIQDELVAANSMGLLTINSQPAVNGARSTDPVFGWGPRNGYVYQKSYIEFLVHPAMIDALLANMKKDANITYYLVDVKGDLKTNSEADGPNALTWGIFPGKEVIQPTIIEVVSFLAWKDEAFRLGEDWAHCYPAGSATRDLISQVMSEWWLCVIVHNDFQARDAISKIYDGLVPLRKLRPELWGAADE